MNADASSEFREKVVIVTGGASGIGGATTRAFARAGAKVAFTYATSAREAEEIETEIVGNGGICLALQADMTSPEDVENVFIETEEKLGPVDIVFANAGGLLQRVRCVDTPLDLWRKVMDVNLTSTFLTCQAALKRMEPRQRGNIITMASLAAFDGGGAGASHYAASKGAVVTYTRAWAKEVAGLGIRVNGVAPGLIATRFHDLFSTVNGRKATVEKTPVRREGRPEDVAQAVLFLASERSSFISGEMIQINGGLAVF